MCFNIKNEILALAAATLVAVTGRGCNKKYNDIAEKYLTSKQDDSFIFVSYGNDSWSSVNTTLVYKDNQNNEFNVKISDDFAMDNYASVLYDKELQSNLQKN